MTDISHILPFNAFLTLCLLALIGIGFFHSDKKGK